ncbi:MAG TPA: serine/threonine-protein kinase, partial [Gemmatimonadaceae bacterium]|nr:serine/threonine-protein kinase [Gemmatimonadaceae bacterium]
TLDRDVVVKVLSGEQTAGVSADRFRREIQLIAKLQHPHVVSILSAGTASGSLYYMMPFVAGETLRERITREGPLPIADAMRLLREVLDALAFAHDHGVVHRDIKPENVLIAVGHAVVADFGIAKALKESGNMTSVGFAIGTPAYMAPEQATADPATDHRADLYAVGVLGYELLTGAPPFTGSAQQVITSHITTPPAPIRSRRADVPDALADVITRALAKDPAERPQTAREMIAAFDSAATPSRTPSPSSASRTRRTLPYAAAAALVLALAAAGAYAARTRTSATPEPMVAAGADVIAVMPLSAVSDSSLARLGQDLVVTLSTNLDGVGSLHTVDAVTLLMKARAAKLPLPLQDARTFARELGARSVLRGTLIDQGGRVLASVTLHRVGSDSVIAKATALASAGDIASLTDSLTWGILRQVWQHGTPPSPVLTGLTTKSVDALRAFLDGERRFQRLETDSAIADYRRAFELDSNFVQALLRYDYVNEWALNDEDSIAHARLLALKDRLPQRERLWLEGRELDTTFQGRVANWKKLAAQYPDYPPILMSAADPIVHLGPIYGIPIADARPYLDRLEKLVPEHGDTRMHVAFVTAAIGSADSAAIAMKNAGRVMGDPWSGLLTWMGGLYASQAHGTPLPPLDDAVKMGREWVEQGRTQPGVAAFWGLMGMDTYGAPHRLAALDHTRASGVFRREEDVMTTLGEGMLRGSRGDWTGAMRAFHRTEGSSFSYHERITSARVAVIGAWLDAMDVAVADSALARAHAIHDDDAQPIDRLELQWLDGVQGVLTRNEARVQTARRAIAADTTLMAHHLARSLAGLWLTRTSADAGADSLKALTDESMREGAFLLSVEAIDRMVVARALRKRGQPAEVDRYLRWPDAATNVIRSMTVKYPFAPLVNYERGVALDEARNRAAAVYSLRQFVRSYDMPPAAHRGLVEDAKKRLARLEAADAVSR